MAQPLRAALTGSLASPGIFEVMEVLGRDESLGPDRRCRRSEASDGVPISHRDIALQIDGV